MTHAIDLVGRWYRRRSRQAVSSIAAPQRRAIVSGQPAAAPHGDGRDQRATALPERAVCAHHWERLWGDQVWTCDTCGAIREELVF